MQESEDRIAAAVYELGEMIHRRLGPGLYESVYRDILAYELRKRGLRVEIEVPVPLVWDELRFDRTYAADIVVEIKAVAEQHPIHKAQALTHTRLLSKRLGLVVNFGLLLFKQGFQRAANGMPA